MARLNECILYRNFEHGEILDKMAELMNAWEQKAPDLKEKEGLFFECANGLVETAGAYGFSGNLWHCYLTFLLVNNENAFSTACEIRGAVNGSINELALNDFGVFKELYDFDLTVLDEAFGISCCKVLGDYTNTGSNSKMFNSRIRDRICDLSKTLAAAESTEEFMKDMVQFYKDFGVGKLGLHKAFRVGHDENDNVEIQPITRIAHVKLEDLVGYEIPKQKLIENTEAFVRGRKANNCLLFGDAGTGKSSSIKGILNRYYDEGLRIIEVYKHQFQDLNDVIAQIKNRNYKFIIYMDDLSFEEFEIEYKYLKAVIEGGLEKKPDNILNRYYDEGLRIIEVYKHQFQDLNDVIAQIKNRNYKFIIYMDDLSFEEFEIEYKYLKAVIEGGLEKKPDNILIYATSNRRHLVREKSSDKLEIMDDDDLHSSDTVQEKLSLVYRFGVRIYYGAPSKKEFQTIVKALAERNGITMPENELLLEANKWELSHGGLTGRTAQQFIDHLLGVEKE